MNELRQRFGSRGGNQGLRLLTSCGNREMSVQAADDADELSLDPDVGVELRRVGGVRGLQPDPILFAEEALERDGVLLDLRDNDVAIAGRLLRANDDVIAVRDVGLDHRVAADAKDVRVAAWREDLGD